MKKQKEENKQKLTRILVIGSIIILFLGMSVFKNTEKKTENNTNTIKGFELLASSDFNKEEFLNMGYPTLLDVGGEDCLLCKNTLEVLKLLNAELMGKAIIKFIDVWKYEYLATQFEFNAIPTQFFYDENGDLYKIHRGEINRDQALAIFKEMGYDFNE